MNVLGLRKEICEGHLGGGVHAVLGKIITKQLPGDFLGEETWFLCAHILPSPRSCPICYEILDPLRIIRLEVVGYVSEYELDFLETAWDVGYLTHLYFHSPLINLTEAERTLKVKGESLGSCGILVRLC